MPLVTMKCRAHWYPARASDSLAYGLAQSLPLLLTENSNELMLDEGTPPEAVQVDFQRFDGLSINTPDIWLLVLFTEDPASHTENELREVASKVASRIEGWLDRHGAWVEANFHHSFNHRPKVAIDVFWGPGHGCMMDKQGEVTLSW